MTKFHFRSSAVLVSVCIVLAITVIFTLFMKNTLFASSLPGSPIPSVSIATQTPVPEVICAQWFMLDNNLPPEKRALEEGLPYQTLISSLLHKYASRRLQEA